MMHRTMLSVLFLLAPLLRGADADQDLLRRGPLQLSLKRAVELAISPEGNTNIQLQEEAVREAKARSAEARSALLPNIGSYASETSEIRSLAALGSNTVKLPFNFHLPNQAGPYDITDARFTATQTVFDFSALRRWQAARTGVRATKSEQEHATNEVSALVAKAYVAALRADADVEAANADVALAKALVTQAQNQKTAGTGTGIEITRQKTKLADQTQRLLQSQNERTKSHLQLLRAIGLRLDTEFELTDKLVYTQEEPLTIEQAKAEAFKNREDYKAQQEHENSTRLLASAAKYERLPSIMSWGDYGTIGQTDIAIMPTRDFGITLKFPIFDGGRIDAQRAEEFSIYRQEKIKSNDLRQQIELDVRTALDSLHSAEEQVRVAQEGLELAGSELTQARRRYEAGITSGLEITDAQTQLEHARDNQIAALFGYNLAHLDLGEAMGTIRRLIQ
jgi:outer membrane protein